MSSGGGKWYIPLLLVAGFVFILGFRQLSDPDLGFHLKYGEWISTNLQIPRQDLSTYTVSGHSYTDLHWLFQVILYQVYRAGGYPMISMFFCLAGCIIFLLLLYLNKRDQVPLPYSIAWLLVTFIILDPRIAPRPEMFSFILMIAVLIILDGYYRHKRMLLWLLPVIMVFWCNVHALFILGIGIMLIYAFSHWVRDKKPDLRLLAWITAALMACLLNPYGLKGMLFPLALLSRFEATNIFHQHIQEFIPFFSQPEFQVRDYLFMAMLGITVFLSILNWRQTRLHEAILVVLMTALAMVSVRNLPLFVLVAFPVVSRHSYATAQRIRLFSRLPGWIPLAILVVVPLILIPRLVTNAYYLDSKSFNKTGLGVNIHHQPAMASAFLTKNHLDGRILNSIGFGGWLSWTLPQPVFIDGRLEVMQEALYQEVTTSWRGELPALITRYNPDLIVYNYLKYFPWTLQLRRMKAWRLIYLDGVAAVFARHGYRPDIPGLSLAGVPAGCDQHALAELDHWVSGFYRPRDFDLIDRLHMTMVRAEMMPRLNTSDGRQHARYCFNEANRRYNQADYAGATIFYDSAILLNPAYARAYNNRGILRAGPLHDIRGALQDFQEAARLEPSYAEAWLGSGSARLMMRDTAGALSDWHHAASLGNVQASRLIRRYCSPR